MIGPTTVCSPAPIRRTASGSNFTGGAVRTAIQWLPPVPQS